VVLIRVATEGRKDDRETVVVMLGAVLGQPGKIRGSDPA
jgi:hypothetical protein